MTPRNPVAQHCGLNAGPHPFMGSVSQGPAATASAPVRRCSWVLSFEAWRRDGVDAWGVRIRRSGSFRPSTSASFGSGY